MIFHQPINVGKEVLSVYVVRFAMDGHSWKWPDTFRRTVGTITFVRGEHPFRMTKYFGDLGVAGFIKPLNLYKILI